MMLFEVWKMVDGDFTRLLDVTLEQVLVMAKEAAMRHEPFEFFPRK